MNNPKNKTNSRSKSTSSTPPRSSSMFDFHRAQDQFLPPASGYFPPYMLPPWPMNYMYMDWVRQLSMGRELRNAEGWEFGERERGSKRSARYDERRNLRGRHWDHSDVARTRSPSVRAPFRQQRLHGGGRGRRRRDRPLIRPESSSSDESLAPCNSCKCCRYFSESCSVLNIVGRAKCGRKYLDDQLFDQRCQGQHNCNHHTHPAAPPDIPVREKPASRRRKSGKRTPKKHDTSADRRANGKRDKGKEKVNDIEDEPERDDSDTASDGKSDTESEANGASRFRGGTGDERSVECQTKMSVNKKPRPKSTAYFLPISYLNSNL